MSKGSKNYYDAIVLGVGGMGSATCYYLAKQNIKTLGIEQFAIGHNQGSSHGETRLIRKAYFEHPNYVPLLHKAYKNWEELCIESAKKLFHKTGLVIFGQEQTSKVIKGIRASATQHQLAIELLDQQAAQNQFPMYVPPKNFIAAYEQDAGYLEVENCVKTYAELARNHDAEIHENETVLSWQTDRNSIIVTTNKQHYQSKKLIITAGPWAKHILYDLNLPLKVHRVVLSWFAVQFQKTFFLTSPCFGFDLPQGFFYGFPSADYTQIKAAFHTPGKSINHPNELNRSIDPMIDVDPIAQTLTTVINGKVKAHLNSAVCMYTLSPDENFIIDFHPEYKNVVFACGFSGHGFKFAAVIGEILAQMAVTQKYNQLAEFLQLKRFKTDRLYCFKEYKS